MANEKGFSIIEFIVTMTLLLLIFAAAFAIFVPVARRSKIEGGNVQTQIEGVIGLELLRKDIVHAGSGTPWNMNGVSYNEATQPDRDTFNDTGAGPNPDEPPRPIIVQNAIAVAGLGFNSSDYLVVKSVLVANPITTDGTNYVDNPASQKWTYVNPTTAPSPGTVRSWSSTADDLVANDRVIVIEPANGTDSMVLTKDGTGVFFAAMGGSATPLPAAFVPTGNVASYVFGVDSTTNLRMPFNRADYYLSKVNVPKRCKEGTGVLVKTVLRQDNGQMGKEFPLLDCVATFQVVLGVDSDVSDNNGQKNCLTNSLTNVTITGPPVGAQNPPTAADTVRSAVKEVRVYILVQEGAFDTDYNFTNFTGGGTNILVGEASPADCATPATTTSQSCDCSGTSADATLGVSFDLSSLPNTLFGGTQPYNKFRWRVYKMVIKPESIVTVSAATGG